MSVSLLAAHNITSPKLDPADDAQNEWDRLARKQEIDDMLYDTFLKQIKLDDSITKDLWSAIITDSEDKVDEFLEAQKKLAWAYVESSAPEDYQDD